MVGSSPILTSVGKSHDHVRPQAYGAWASGTARDRDATGGRGDRMFGLIERLFGVKRALFDILTEERYPQVTRRPGAAGTRRPHGLPAHRPAPAAGRCPGSARRARPLDPPTLVVGRRSSRRALHRHHRHGFGQEPLLQPPRHRPPGQERERAGPLPLPHEGPGPGSDAPAAFPRRGQDGVGGVRRRHARRRPPPGPPTQPPAADQPRHAQHGHAAAPRALGRLLLQSELRRHRRGPHLPGSLWKPHRQRAPATPPRSRLLRRRTPVHPGLGHHRQRHRARGTAHRAAHLARDRRRRPQRPPQDPAVEPALGGRTAQPALEQHHGSGGHPGRAHAERGAHHLLHQVAQERRACLPAHRRPPLRRTQRPGQAPLSLPRGLHAGATAGHRSPAVQRRPPGGGQHQRPGTRHRRGRPRRRDHGGLSRHRGQPVAAVGPGRAQQG